MGLREYFEKYAGPLLCLGSSFSLGAGNQSQRRCGDQGNPA